MWKINLCIFPRDSSHFAIFRDTSRVSSSRELIDKMDKFCMHFGEKLHRDVICARSAVGKCRADDDAVGLGPSCPFWPRGRTSRIHVMPFPAFFVRDVTQRYRYQHRYRDSHPNADPNDRFIYPAVAFSCEEIGIFLLTSKRRRNSFQLYSAIA